MPDSDQKIIPAATILILRDGPGGLEVLMVKRNHAIDFASGALVFPGGKLASGDDEPVLSELCHGLHLLPPSGLGFAVAAVREAFEESGLLLAYDRRAGGALVGPERLGHLDRYRKLLDRGDITMRAFLAAEGLELALDRLVPFAHWVTPNVMPKRFDTHFFAAAAPADQIARHDGSESVDSLWIGPAKALADAEDGKATIVFATRMNLKMLAESNTVTEALSAAQARKVVTVMPELDNDAPGGAVLRIPAEAGYGITEVPLDRVSR